MGRVLYVSKPIVPPWNDSSKNLARLLAAEVEGHSLRVMTDGSEIDLPSRVERAAVYAGGGAFAPGLASQLRVLRALATGPKVDLWHFFFAPNPRSSTAARALAGARRVRTVQTVCSRPSDPRRAPRLLFADKSVVVSRASRVALLDAGVAPERLAHVPPAVPPLDPPTDADRCATRRELGLPEGAPIVVYPGDLEHSRGAARMINAFLAEALADEALLVMACRDKTPEARRVEARLRARAAPLGPRVRWIGETPRIHDLLGAADVVALPSTDLYAKMDLPLVLLEAMWLERAILVVHDSPAAELAEGGGAIATDPDAEAVGAALARLLEDDDARRERGRAAREVVGTRYDASSMARAYEAIYDELLA